MKLRVKHERLIARICWSYHYTTGIDFEELMAEGLAAYCEAVHTYDPQRGKLTKRVSTLVNQRLCRYLARERRNNHDSFDHWMNSENQDDYWENRYNIPAVFALPYVELQLSMGADVRVIADMILEDPYAFLSVPPKIARGVVVNRLRNRGWKWPRIWRAMRLIKDLLNKTAPSGIIY